MEKYFRINIDPLNGWLPPETDDELHERLYSFTMMSARAFGWPVGGEEFFKTYNRLKDISLHAREYHEHMVLMAVLTLKDLMDDGRMMFEDTFKTEDDVHKAMKNVVRRLVLVFEQIAFSEKMFTPVERLLELPEKMRTVDFLFEVNTSPFAAEYDNNVEEVFNNLFEKLEDSDELDALYWKELFGTENDLEDDSE
jgi:hypothetical protein